MVTDNHETAGASSSPELSPSPSAISLGSINTSFTGDSSTTVSSMAYSTGPYEHVTHGSSMSFEQSSQTGQRNKGSGASDPISINTYVDVGDLSSNANQYGLCENRYCFASGTSTVFSLMESLGAGFFFPSRNLLCCSSPSYCHSMLEMYTWNVR